LGRGRERQVAPIRFGGEGRLEGGENAVRIADGKNARDTGRKALRESLENVLGLGDGGAIVSDEKYQTLALYRECANREGVRRVSERRSDLDSLIRDRRRDTDDGPGQRRDGVAIKGSNQIEGVSDIGRGSRDADRPANGGGLYASKELGQSLGYSLSGGAINAGIANGDGLRAFTGGNGYDVSNSAERQTIRYRDLLESRKGVPDGERTPGPIDTSREVPGDRKSEAGMIHDQELRKIADRDVVKLKKRNLRRRGEIYRTHRRKARIVRTTCARKGIFAGELCEIVFGESDDARIRSGDRPALNRWKRRVAGGEGQRDRNKEEKTAYVHWMVLREVENIKEIGPSRTL